MGKAGRFRVSGFGLSEICNTDYKTVRVLSKRNLIRNLIIIKSRAVANGEICGSPFADGSLYFGL